MKVVLKQDVADLGKAGDIKDVDDGYGRNYLLARGLASQATQDLNPQAWARQMAQIFSVSPPALGEQLNTLLENIRDGKKLSSIDLNTETLPLVDRLYALLESIHDGETVDLHELVRLVERLNIALERISDDVIEVSSLAIPLDLTPAEIELLQKINQALPAELGQRYSALIAKRDAEDLMPDEHEELINLTDQVEELEAQRIAYLVELAQLRNTTVAALIQELDIRPSVYV